MDASFWHNKWARGEIAFHESAANPLLTTYFNALNLAQHSRVFVPLCGKTRDIAWLLACGYRVAGAELSELAINELFVELGVTPDITQVGKLLRYSATDIEILVGDFFEVSSAHLGPVSAIYDRAALVALPEHLRKHYTRHLMDITEAASQLLITYEYDQRLADGPPFSVTEAEVKTHYEANYALTAVASKNVAGGLKGKVASSETVWILEKHSN